MTDTAIKVEDLGKLYHIGARKDQYQTLRGALVSGIKRFTGKHTTKEPMDNTIWALKDVSFEIKQGDAVGIIGRNGAGKSTLLKVLSHITEPTRGDVFLYGRVGSLLEVGTGFHPELTGRDNIYLNGAILGMKRKEVARQFDEIVAFSEVEKFLDTPVKRYSSGMYMRLAFAVAAHLEPEILLVDEVLAVGDAAFQKKCLGKMGNIAKGGRTVLFVSHNMAAVRRLCTSCLYFDSGHVSFFGGTEETIAFYLDAPKNQLYAEFGPLTDSPIRLRRIEIRDVHDKLMSGDVETANGFYIRVQYEINRPIQGIHAFLRIHTSDGETLLSSGDADIETERLGMRKAGSYIADVFIPARLLGEGQYTITWSAGVPFQANFDVQFHALSFHVVDMLAKRVDHIHQRRPGLLGLDIPWNYKKLEPK